MPGKRLPMIAVFLVVLGVAACNPTVPDSVFPVTPVCTPAPGLTVDPCAPQLRAAEVGGALLEWSDTPGGVAEYVDGGLTSMAHIVLRATYLADSVRCTADRDQSWQDADDLSYLSSLTSVDCYADVLANEYYVGSGPAEFTVQVLWEWYAVGDHADAIRRDWRGEIENALKTGGDHYLDISAPEGGIEGKERILFIGPALDMATQSWRVNSSWRVERLTDGTVVAVNPARWRFLAYPEYDFEAHKSTLEMPLDDFKAAAVAAHKARMVDHGGRIGEALDLPRIINSVGELEQYYRAVGAYSHPDGPPTMPPPP